jgi:hypothetical protein
MLVCLGGLGGGLRDDEERVEEGVIDVESKQRR